MKKILLSLGTIAAIAAPVTAVVSCAEDIADPKVFSADADNATSAAKFIKFLEGNQGKKVSVTIGTGKSAVTTHYSVPYLGRDPKAALPFVKPTTKPTVTTIAAAITDYHLIDISGIFAIDVPQIAFNTPAKAKAFAEKIFKESVVGGDVVFTYVPATTSAKAYWTVTGNGSKVMHNDAKGKSVPSDANTHFASLADFAGKFYNTFPSWIAKKAKSLILSHTAI